MPTTPLWGLITTTTAATTTPTTTTTTNHIDGGRIIGIAATISIATKMLVTFLCNMALISISFL